MFEVARSALMTKGYKFYSECDRYILFRNWALSTTIKFDKKNPSYRVYDTFTGHAVSVRWGVQKAINELFKVYDHRAIGLVQYVCMELNVTRQQLAEMIPIDRYVLKRAEEDMSSVTDSSLEKIINYAESMGLQL